MSWLPDPEPLLRADWWALGAVLSLSVMAMLLLLVERLPDPTGGHRAGVFSLFAIALGAFAVLRVAPFERSLFGGMFVHDRFTLFFTLVILGGAAVAVLLAWDYLGRLRLHPGEYHALLLLATVGMIVMAASNDLITIFLGLELMSIALYILVGYRRDHLESNEASLKYFLLGAFASGFLLFGIALVYGATGSTHLRGIAAFLGDSPIVGSPLLLVGGALMLVGLFFKVAAVPFHMWTPDAYEGAPTSVTAFMAAGAKAAGFAALLRIMLVALPEFGVDWRPLVAAVAVATMTVGNVTALLQDSVKRMLAYSSIAHAGYVLAAVVVGGPAGGAAAAFYLAVYAVTTLGAFGTLTLFGRGHEERDRLADFDGLAWRHPALALLMTLFLLSLGGIPPTAGFMAKAYVFSAVVDAGWIPLAVIGVLNGVVAIFYYLRVTVAMYMREPAGEPAAVSSGVAALLALAITAALVVWWGVDAERLLAFARESVRGLL